MALTAAQRDIFNCVDADGGGSVGFEEVRQFCTIAAKGFAHVKGYEKAENREAFENFGGDDISKAIRSSVTPTKEGEQPSLFLLIDEDKSGKVDTEEVLLFFE
eukprot:gene5206-32363_t